MKKIVIIILVVVIIALALFLSLNINYFYYLKSFKIGGYKYPSTYFIEPSNLFVSCYKTDDCIKVKGSACQPSKGGVETCINKNYMQEYLSNIENLAGKYWEVNCPNVNNSTNKECSCVNNNCNLVS